MITEAAGIGVGEKRAVNFRRGCDWVPVYRIREVKILRQWGCKPPTSPPPPTPTSGSRGKGCEEASGVAVTGERAAAVLLRDGKAEFIAAEKDIIAEIAGAYPR